MMDRQQGLFTPGRKYNSHSNVGGYFAGRNAFAGPNFPMQAQNPNNWVNNNINLFSNNYYSNNSNASGGGYNSQKANLFIASNKKNSSNNSLRYNDTDYSSSNEMMGNYNTFNNNNDFVNFGNLNNLNQINRNNPCGVDRIENSMANLSIGSNMGSMNGSFVGSMTGSNSLASSMNNLSSLNGINSMNSMNGLCNGMGSLNTLNTLNRPKKKGYSTGMVSHHYQGNFNKKPSFNHNNHLGNLNNPNQKKRSNNNTNNNFREREDEEEDLETFLEELDGEVHTFICSQKGSR
jgi:hypothetical protein